MISNKRSITVGWCFSIKEGSSAFDRPEILTLPKDLTPNKRGFLSCPAVRHSLQGVVSVKSPFSLHLKFSKLKEGFAITPVYPLTSIGEGRLSATLRLEPYESWRSEDVPVLQLPSPYVFLADQFLEVEQFSPSIVQTTNLNWRVIPGRFNIYGWHRPLNWAIEWDTKCGDLIIKQGEPLYFLRFFNENGNVVENVKLVEAEFTKELENSIANTTGVTSVRRGFVTVMEKATQRRNKPLIKPKR